MKKIVLFANTAWYLYNFRLPLAHALVERGWHVILIAPKDRYIASLRDQGFTVIELRMNRRSLNPLQELALILRLSHLLKGLKPNVIFNFTIKCVVHGSIAARLAGLHRRVNTVAGMGSVFSSRHWAMKLLKPAVRFLMKHSLAGRHSHCIVQNPDDQTFFLNNGIISPGQLHLIKGSGVDGSRFQPSASWLARQSHTPTPTSPYPSCSGNKRVLFASRLLRSKGIDYFIGAAKQLGEAYEFCIAGQPDPGNPESLQQEDLDQLCHTNITLLGHIEDMAPLLRSVDLVVLPSMYGEGVPRILVEAAATGLPLIAFDTAGCREIVVDGRNGYLVKPGNQQALNQAIQSIFSSQQHYQTLATNSRRHFLSQFEQCSVIAATINIIDLTAADNKIPATSASN